jgi:pimeloyl-ACP methyl ester carboxylesterase
MRKFFMRGVLALVILLIAAIGVGLIIGWAPDRPMQELVKQWAPPPSSFIDVKGLRVHVRDEGDRTDPVPVVLIHGTSASLHTWEGWVDVLKQQRRVITFAQSNFDGAESRIKTIKQPTLILWGGRDLLIPVENARNFQRDIAGSQLAIFDELGHVPHEEDPARTIAAVQAFLKG